ncbi:TPA: hypothetical protein DCX66_04020 [Candidatus Nomurabacteria bacterium]|uniref:Phosphoglycerate mutase n=1 Tax=Candidatus Nomurabacteria bacterium GW2011_GWE1_35_16 TaxID=1618761 RepID=A0A0G0B9W8_9BACT|nr:MAG: hypothetical protein UR55_C0012G0016 [Candidatus Nomurabacteria bacterium GW2011_GWF1_34_20]KKP62795.1 MAG: hypothetical protein UR57_C0011G0014 [Candidatus Nomurabacteria bacterium GW2011_GWE2_34_25]KKP66193.1 MAG: hypothetical protein UR64_C0011G0015 [Candidatus Nomurabacteria bacterium GW2011_GWE1_35_16]HAE36250.1 hypothetical protein [Candidatus Nomurabacteria bacterium]HAX65605.1 hypothetical protein [Candidatus Nomurabacteria bacterium]
MKIYFLKTAQYDLRKNKNDRYDYLCDLGLQKIDPLPLHINSLTPMTKYVINSTLKRVALSFQNSSGSIFVPSDNLREVIFDMSTMCTKQEFNKLGSSIVREKFIELFINDTLPQKRLFLFDQIRSTLEQIKLINCEEITIVSHSFKLKLFEAYLKTNGQIESHPELIRNYIYIDKKTFNFNEGFEYMI